MFEKILCVAALLFVFGCTDAREMRSSKSDTFSPYSNSQNVRLATTDYIKVGQVEGEFTKTCFLLNTFCYGDKMYIYDDLLKKGQAMGADIISNVNVDPDTRSILWGILYYRKSYKANGLALKLKK